jgi:exonuclease III
MASGTGSTTILSPKANIICLQETKVSDLFPHLLLSVCGSRFDKFLTLPADGTRGGILIAWKCVVCQAISSRVDNYSVSVQFAGHDGMNWWPTSMPGQSIKKMRRGARKT